MQKKIVVKNGIQFHIDPEYIQDLQQESIVDGESIYSLAEVGEQVAKGTTVKAWRRPFRDYFIYVKRYLHLRPSWKYAWRTSRAKKELQAYSLFARWQIPHPEVVCFAEKRIWRRLCWSIIVTREVEGSDDLQNLFKKEEHDTPLRLAIMSQLGEMASAMHRQKFYNPTFRLRNILWRLDQQDNPQLFLIDCPSYRVYPFYIHWVLLHNLMRLYADARVLCSPQEWQAFLEVFCQKAGFDYDYLATEIPARCLRRFGPPAQSKRFRK